MGRMKDLAIDNTIIEDAEQQIRETEENDGWLDSCTYQNPEGFKIEYDGETGLWNCYTPDGEWISNFTDGKEAMSHIDICAVDADEGHPNNFGAK